jgi:hypothetical protein
MKTIFLVGLVAIVFLFPIGCQKKESPTERPVLTKGEYIGSFSVTFKNYQNIPGKVTQSGSVAFLFSDSSYQYNGTVVHNSLKDSSFSIGDHGGYSLFDEKIRMTDISWLLMSPTWRSSLYLTDTFVVRTVGQQFIITQENSFAIWELKLNSK